ncbi:MAG: hypothetical protein IPL40_07440 [Proteobacteria bacterium]|nr:hypothetical protein [Pseudomonadota bacterium]
MLLRGPAVLRCKTARALYGCWALLALVATLPTPLRSLLRQRADALSSAGPAALAGSAGGPPSLPFAPSPQNPAAAPDPAAVPLPAAEPERVQAIEDPRGALQPYFVALEALQRTRQGVVRVLHFGDSQIDLDHVTGPLRAIARQRHGDGGLGYVPALRPWPWFYLNGLTLDEQGSWERLRLSGGSGVSRRRDGRLGLGGLAAQTVAGGASAQLALAATERASTITLAYLAQPGGGTIELRLDGRRAAQLSTSAARPQAAWHTLSVDDARHSATARASGRVRLFGFVFERPGPGITWENLPLVGTRFHQLTGIHAEHWIEQLAQRRPNLVLFQFGANDTISWGASLAQYAARVGEVLDRLHRGAPQAGCLIVGPLDRLVREGGGRFVAPPTVARMVATQRTIAAHHRCAFWDAREAMGGPGALSRWIARGLVRKDLLHLNERGGRALAEQLDRALQQAEHVARVAPR